MTRIITILLTVFFLIGQAASAQAVYARDGNIFLSDSSRAIHQLTSANADTLPVYSQQSGFVAFIRVSRTSGTSTRALWFIKTDGSGLTKILTESANRDPKQNTTGIADLRFSLDGKHLYFDTEAWVTSAAVHQADLATARIRLVTDGSLDSVIPRGACKGDLIVNKHRYFVGGGSYDWYWVVDPVTGKDVGPIGESTDDFYRSLK